MGQQVRERAKGEILIVLLFMSFAFFINRQIQIKGLYMDDLYLWSCYGEQSFREFVFPIGSTRFRFVYYLAAWLELAFVGNHITWFVPINILVNSCIAYTVYRFGRTLSRNVVIGFVCGFLYLLSRMSYYQIGQVYGLMESMALWGALGILYCLYCWIGEGEEKNKKKYLGLALGLYLAVCFVHERYMALLPLFYLAYIIKKEKRFIPWLTVTGAFLAVQLVRVLTIGTIAPAGTGGTDVTDTFQIGDALKYAVSQVLYIFGINAGPGHLNGYSWGESPFWIHMLVLAADVCLAVFVLLFVMEFIRNKKSRGRYIGVTLLFITFIALCIGSSSVTIRVEMRWVYVSMTAAWLYAAWIFGVLTKKPENRIKGAGLYVNVICMGLILLYLILMLPVEVFYRGKYENLYFWADQQRYNSLAEETYETYGEEIFGKQIYILDNSYNMSDFTARTYFKEFDRDRKAEGTEVHFIESIDEIGLITPNMLVLEEDPAHNAYKDVTSLVKELKCQSQSGYYSDGWMDEKASVRILAGKTGTIGIKFYYPGQLEGQETCTIRINGQEEIMVPITESSVEAEIQAEPGQFVELEFDNDFYYPEAGEQRGEYRFSMIVEFTAD